MGWHQQRQQEVRRAENLGSSFQMIKRTAPTLDPNWVSAGANQGSYI